MGRSFKDLIVWQRAVELTTSVYQLTARFAESERFGLTNQLRRAAISVVSNIAEGYGRSSKGEYRLFLGHARGSSAEVEAQLYVATKLRFSTRESAEKAERLSSEVGRMLNAMMKTLRERN